MAIGTRRGEVGILEAQSREFVAFGNPHRSYVGAVFFDEEQRLLISFGRGPGLMAFRVPL